MWSNEYQGRQIVYKVLSGKCFSLSENFPEENGVARSNITDILAGFLF